MNIFNIVLVVFPIVFQQPYQGMINVLRINEDIVYLYIFKFSI